ncbi:MAG: hypothetical protein AAGM36_15075 [Cyanobacteria bacterium J06597_1]
MSKQTRNLQTRFSRLKKSQNSKGFSLVELLAASLVGASVIGVASSLIFFNRNLYLKDSSRTQVNQNLRASIDLIGFDVRQAGERLPADFPAVVLNEGGNPVGPDNLVIYRALVDIVLNVCDTVNSGSSSDISLAVIPEDPLNSRCLPDSVKDAEIATWENYRTSNGGIVNAYIYDPVTQLGEFFDYDNEVTSNTNYSLSRDGGSWTNDYPIANNPRVYLMEERTFLLTNLSPNPPNCFTDTAGSPDVLTLVINGDCTNQRFGLTDNIDDFQAQVCFQSGANCVDSLTFATAANAATGWTDISSVDISVTGSTNFAAGRATSRTVESRFFPRNVLSF